MIDDRGELVSLEAEQYQESTPTEKLAILLTMCMHQLYHMQKNFVLSK